MEKLMAEVNGVDTSHSSPKATVSNQSSINGNTYKFISTRGKLEKKDITVIVGEQTVTIGNKTLFISKKTNGGIYVYDENVLGEVTPYIVTIGDNYLSIGTATLYTELPLTMYVIKKGDTRKVLVRKGIPESSLPSIPHIGDTIFYAK